MLHDHRIVADVPIAVKNTMNKEFVTETVNPVPHRQFQTGFSLLPKHVKVWRGETERQDGAFRFAGVLCGRGCGKMKRNMGVFFGGAQNDCSCEAFVDWRVDFTIEDYVSITDSPSKKAEDVRRTIETQCRGSGLACSGMR
jgi:hypothetical protein